MLDGTVGARRPRRGRRAALEPVARPGGPRPGRPRPNSTPSWRGTPRRPAAPATPRHSPPGRTPPSRLPPGTRRSTARTCPTSCSAPPSPGSTPARRHCWTPLWNRTSSCLETVWAERSIEIASRIVRGLYPGRSGPRRSGRTPRRMHPVVVRDRRLAAGPPGRAAGAAPDHHRAAEPPAPRAHGAGPHSPDPGRKPHRLLRNCRFDRSNGSYGALDGISMARGAATRACRTWTSTRCRAAPVPRR